MIAANSPSAADVATELVSNDEHRARITPDPTPPRRLPWYYWLWIPAVLALASLHLPWGGCTGCPASAAAGGGGKTIVEVAEECEESCDDCCVSVNSCPGGDIDSCVMHAMVDNTSTGSARQSAELEALRHCSAICMANNGSDCTSCSDDCSSEKTRKRKTKKRKKVELSEEKEEPADESDAEDADVPDAG